MAKHLLELAMYDMWANRMVLRAVDRAPACDERVRKLINHLGSAKLIWIARINGENTQGMETWPELDIVKAATRLAQGDARLYALTMSPDFDADRVVKYTNQKGEPFESTVGEIVTQLITHGAYHRGQLATAIKNCGGDLGFTDYIMWVRQGRPMA